MNDRHGNGVHIVAVQSLYRNNQQELMLVGTKFSSRPLFRNPYNSTEIGIYDCNLPRGDEIGNTVVWNFEQVTAKMFPLPTKLNESFNPNNVNQRWIMTTMRHSEV